MIIRNSASHQRAPCIVNQTDETRACAMRVVLADDHPIVLGGLGALLLAERGVDRGAGAGSTGARTAIPSHRPHAGLEPVPRPASQRASQKLGKPNLITAVPHYGQGYW